MLLHDRPFQPPGLGRSRRAITATSPVTTADQGIIIDATSGTYDVTTATAASTFGSGFSFGLYNSGTGVVSFNPNGAETVRTPAGTATTVALTQGMGVFVVCDGTNWDVVCSIGLAAAPTTPLTVRDNAFTITDETDTTKTLVTSVGGQSAGVDVIFSTGAQTTDVTLTVPVLAASDAFAMLSVANLFTNKNGFGAGTAVGAGNSHRFESNSGQSGTTQVMVVMLATAQGACTTLRGLSFTSSTDNTTHTITSLIGGFFGVNTKGANDTVTRSGGLHVRQQTVGATGNFGVVYSTATGLPAAAGTFAWYNDEADGEYHGTGTNQFAATTDASSLTTGAGTTLGGWSIAKTLIAGKGLGLGVTSTATAAGTTVLAQASAVIQIFTGTSTQTVTLPAANLWGAGVAVTYIIKNRSTLAVTINRAGSDTIDGGTSYVLAGNVNASVMLASDGVSEWEAL